MILKVKPEDARIVDTEGYGYYLQVKGTDGKWYNFFGNRPLNDAILEKALSNCSLEKCEVQIVEYSDIL